MTDYHRYMASREWRVRRRAALLRSQNLCERCWGRAAQVHHLTYERLGDEKPEDLMAICRGCHEFLSAVADVDPLLALPSLFDADGRALAEMVKVLAAAERAEAIPTGDDPWRGIGAVACILRDVVAIWLEHSGARYVSLPDRHCAVASALCLRAIIEAEFEIEIQPIIIAAAEVVGLGYEDDPYRRWRVPVWAKTP